MVECLGAMLGLLVICRGSIGWVSCLDAMAGQLGDMEGCHESLGVMPVEKARHRLCYLGSMLSQGLAIGSYFPGCFGCRFACCFGDAAGILVDNVLFLVLFKSDHLFWFESTHVIWVYAGIICR